MEQDNKEFEKRFVCYNRRCNQRMPNDDYEPITENSLTEHGFECKVRKGAVSIWQKEFATVEIWGERIKLNIDDGAKMLSVTPVRNLCDLKMFMEWAMNIDSQ